MHVRSRGKAFLSIPILTPFFLLLHSPVPIYTRFLTPSFFLSLSSLCLSHSPVPVTATSVDTSDSCMFDKDAGLNPFVTVYSGSTTCGTDATSTVVTTLNPVCEDASATLGMPAWSKWYYRV